MSGIGVNFHAAATALRLNQEAVSVIQQNIANVNTEGYNRREIRQESMEVSGLGQGVEIKGIARVVDQFLIDAVRMKQSDLGFTSELYNYQQRIQEIFGDIDVPYALDNVMNNFFRAFQLLSETPEDTSLRFNAVNAGVTLSGEISSLYKNMNQLRYEIDTNMEDTAIKVNDLVQKITTNNKALAEVSYLHYSDPGLLDMRDSLLKSLSNELGVTTHFLNTNAAYVQTLGGVSLVSSYSAQVEYVGAATVDVFNNDSTAPLNPLTVSQIGSDGDVFNVYEAISGGTRGNITSKIKGGRLEALEIMRDVAIPKILDQLDMLAKTFADTFNGLHNLGAGFPPPTTLTGTRLVDSLYERNMEGSVMISLVHSNGRPLESHYPDEKYLRPLTLDLSSLDSGNGPGKANMQTIMNEINLYFGPPAPRISLGSMYDIRMAAISAGIPATNGQFTFNFEVDNNHAKEASFAVTNIAVNNGANGLVGALPLAQVITSGERTRTSTPITVDFTNGTGGPYTITADISVTNGDGTISQDTLTFLVPTSVVNIKNQRYFATNTAMTGDGHIIQGSGGSYLSANLVDSNNVPISQTGERNGYLQLNTTNTDFSIVVNDNVNNYINQDLGPVNGESPAMATYQSFSHFYGLNDFFDGITDELKNSALNMHVREAIIANPNAVSTGILSASEPPTDPDALPYLSYELGSGNNQAVSSMANLQLQTVFFPSVGDFPSEVTSFIRYVGNIIAFSAMDMQKAGQDYKSTLSKYNIIYDKERSLSGVDKDTELLEVTAREAAYNAMARVIKTQKEMLDALMSIL